METERQASSPFTKKDIEKIEEQIEKFSGRKRQSLYAFLIAFIALLLFFLFKHEEMKSRFLPVCLIAGTIVFVVTLVPFFYIFYQEKKLQDDLMSGTRMVATFTLTGKKVVSLQNMSHYVFEFDKKIMFADYDLFENAEKGMQFDIYTTPKYEMLLEIKPHQSPTGKNDFV